MNMDVDTAKKLIETLIQVATIEINSIKSQVVSELAMQVAIYSHDRLHETTGDAARFTS